MRVVPILTFIMGALTLFSVQTAGLALWPYQRTSVAVCYSGNVRDAAEADLRQHLETGWEIEHTDVSRTGQFDCPTYILRKR